MDRAKALSRLRKCLALAASSNPNEAATALRQAQALMKEYQLTEADVEAAEIKEASYRSRVSATKQHAWESNLVCLIEKAFGVKALYRRGNSRGSSAAEVFAQYTFIGPEPQCSLAAYTMDVLSRQITKGRAAFLKANQVQYVSRTEMKLGGDGYCLGFVKALEDKVDDFAGVDRSRAIALYVEQRFGRVEPGKALAFRADHSALQQGYEDGQQAYLNRPVNGEALRRLA